MTRHLGVIALVILTSLVGCHKETGDYIAASAISKNGFARHGHEMRRRHGRDIKIWGFVDHANLYGSNGAKTILEDWWSGAEPNPRTWRFNLKAAEHDEAGHSFPVRVPNDQGRDALLGEFLADARAKRPTKVFVQGKIFTFDAPTNLGPHTGLYMELQSSRAILLDLPEEK